MLENRVINVTVVEKYTELSKGGSSPICLFPTRKACKEFNGQIISALDNELHKIVCIDEIDETSSSHKWSKKAQKQLEKLNNDSNLTAGLEAELTLAVQARVMLRRNIDTKQGLVNGDEPCPIEMVRSKFMLQKSFLSKHTQCLAADQQQAADRRASESETQRTQRLAAGQQRKSDRRASESDARQEHSLSSNQERIATYRANASLEERQQITFPYY